MAKGIVEFTANWSNFNSAMGTIVGASEELETQLYAASVVEWTHAVAAKQFDVYMSALAKARPKNFHHVYEWEKIGVQTRQLWHHVLAGNGNSGIRIASYTFINSTTPVPQYKGDGSEGLAKSRYIFANKAQVMELGLPVTIKSRHSGGKLFIPGSDLYTDYRGQGYIFSDGPVSVKNPGGDGVKGSFQGAWTAWWSTAGTKVFDTDIKPSLDKKIRKIMTPTRGSATARRGSLGSRTVRLDVDAMAAARMKVRADAAVMRKEARLLANGQ